MSHETEGGCILKLCNAVAGAALVAGTVAATTTGYAYTYTPTEQDRTELTECARRDTLFHCVMHTAERIMSSLVDDLTAPQPPAHLSNFYVWLQGQVLAVCGFNIHEKPHISAKQQKCSDQIAREAGEAVTIGLWDFLHGVPH